MSATLPRIYLSPPHVGAAERHLLLDAFDSGWIAPLGPHVDAFEREVAACVGVGHAAALASGTSALHLALRLLGVGAGDEVLVQSFTFVATVNPVTYLGATPVFIDSEAETWNLDPDCLTQALEDGARRGVLPKAVVAVDLYGRCPDWDRILPICARYGVPVIEDAAEALGATYRGRPAGSFGDAAILSFNGNKIITTSGGGMLVSNDESMISQARHLATQAREPAPHYEHTTVGYNYRLSNLLAAVGRAQLQSLPQRVAARRANFDFYAEHFGSMPGITMMPRGPAEEASCWLTCALVDPDAFGVDREAIRQHLESLNIESRPVWKPMHLQPVFEGARTFGGAVSEGLFARGLCLPSGSNLTDSDRARILDALRSVPGGPR
jgi:dTDP-4-amino-4,6-dideoxygalactose transaminase